MVTAIGGNVMEVTTGEPIPLGCEGRLLPLDAFGQAISTSKRRQPALARTTGLLRWLCGIHRESTPRRGTPDRASSTLMARGQEYPKAQRRPEPDQAMGGYGRDLPCGLQLRGSIARVRG